jgi:hypothetical protein
MALFLAIGASPREVNGINNQGMWFSPYMPDTQADTLSMLSTDFKSMIADPQLHQLQSPISKLH